MRGFLQEMPGIARLSRKELMTARKKRGRPGLSLEDVRKACDALKKQGRNVGPTNVRLELGRGSFETIAKHLRALGYGNAPRRK